VGKNKNIFKARGIPAFINTKEGCNIERAWEKTSKLRVQDCDTAKKGKKKVAKGLQMPGPEGGGGGGGENGFQSRGLTPGFP